MSDESYLGEWIIGDVFPFAFWELTERQYNTVYKRVELYEPDLAVEYDWIKFYSKHENNNCDVNDLTAYDIAGTTLAIDGDNGVIVITNGKGETTEIIISVPDEYTI